MKQKLIAYALGAFVVAALLIVGSADRAEAFTDGNMGGTGDPVRFPPNIPEQYDWEYTKVFWRCAFGNEAACDIKEEMDAAKKD